MSWHRVWKIFLWSTLAVLIGSVILSLSVTLASIVAPTTAAATTSTTPAGPRALAGLYFGLIMYGAFGLLILLPALLMVLSGWSWLSHRFPQLEHSLQTIAGGAAVLAMIFAIAMFALGFSREQPERVAGHVIFALCLFAAAFLGLVLPRVWVRSLAPGAMATR